MPAGRTLAIEIEPNAVIPMRERAWSRSQANAGSALLSCLRKIELNFAAGRAFCVYCLY